MLHQRLRVSQTDGDPAHAEVVHKIHPRLLSALDLNGHHRAEAAHLLLCRLMAGVGGYPREIDGLHSGIRHQVVRQLPGIFTVAHHPELKGLQAPQDQERLLRPQDGAGHVLYAEHPHLIHQVPPAADKARQGVAVAV